jgi:hypothetical protein
LKNTNGIRRDLLSKYVCVLRGVDDSVEGIQYKIVALELGQEFEEVNQSDIQEVLVSHSEKELRNRKFIQLEK